MLRKHEGNRHVTDFGLLRANIVHEKRKRHVVIYKNSLNILTNKNFHSCSKITKREVNTTHENIIVTATVGRQQSGLVRD